MLSEDNPGSIISVLLKQQEQLLHEEVRKAADTLTVAFRELQRTEVNVLAFMKKEYLEAARTGKIMILVLLFVLFGIMSPAIAKLTP